MSYNLNLKYDGFEEHLVIKGNRLDGMQYLFRFDNDYGASVVKNKGSFGHKSDLWELAVIRFDASGDYSLVYDTAITDDVIGHLTDEEVCWYLGRIRELSKCALISH